MLSQRVLRVSGVLSVLLAIALVLFASQAHAQTTTWTWSGTSGAPWTTSSANWTGGSVATPWDTNYGPSDIAYFNTSSASAQISGTVNANGVIFGNTATISGGTLNLAGTTPTITLNTGSGTIGSIITGTNGLIEAANGTNTLVLSGSNTYSGGTTINRGYLQLNSNNAAGAGTITVNTGGNDDSLVLNNVTIANNIVLNQSPGSTNGVLQNTGTSTVTGPINLAGTGWRIGDTNATSTLYLNGQITGGTSSGELVINRYNDGTVVLGASNTFAASDIAIDCNAAGTCLLKMGTAGAIPSAVPITFNYSSSANFGIFDLSGFNQTIGGLYGGNAYTRVTNSAATPATLTINTGTASQNFGGTIDNNNGGALSLVISGGSQQLSGANTFTGNITISGGTLDNAYGNASSGGTSGLGNATIAGRTVTINNGGTLFFGAGNSIAGGGTTPALALVINAGGQVVSGQIANNNVLGNVTLNGGTLTTGSGNGNANYQYQSYELGGTVTVATSASTIAAGPGSNNGINLGINTSAGYQTTFNVAATGGAGPDLTVSAQLFNAGQSESYSGVIKTGAGTMALTASNGYFGTTTVNGGALALAFSAAGAPASNIISNSSSLALGGGVLAIQGSNNAAISQQFNGLTVNAGASALQAFSGTGGTVNATLGTIARNVGGTVDFTVPASGSITTTTNNASFTGGQQTILGGYATSGGTTWAVASGASPYVISGLASYSSGATAFTAGADVDAPTGTTAVPAATYNSLRLNNQGAYTLNLAAGTTTIATGGILETANVGSNTATISGGSLATGNGQDLIVIQNNPGGTLTISSAIAGNTGLTKAGPGTLDLGGRLQTVGAVNITGGVIQNGTLAGSSYVANISAGTATISANLANNSASLTTSGIGTLLLTGSNSYTGVTNINAGTLVASGNGSLPSATNVTFGGTAVLDLGGNSQTVGVLNCTDNGANTIQNGNLTVNGNVQFGANNLTTVVSMSGLSSFTQYAPAGSLQLGTTAYVGSQGANATVTLSPSNTITAGTITEPGGGSNAPQSVDNLYLGQSNTFNASSILIGGPRQTSTWTFASGLTNPTLQIAGTGGIGIGTPPSITVGTFSGGGGYTSGIFNSASGVLNASASTLAIGISTANGQPVTGVFAMGAGTLSAQSIILGADYGGSGAAAGTLNLTATSGFGLIKTGTLTIADRTGSATSGTGTVNLTGGELLANVIQKGAAGTAIFNWSGGTIGNYPGQTLTIGSGLTLTMTGTGAGVQTLYSDPTQSTTVNAVLAGVGGLNIGGGSVALTNQNTYTGGTTINAGSVVLASLNAFQYTGSAGTMKINAGALLDLVSGATGHIPGPIVLSGGTLADVGAPSTAYGSWALDADSVTATSGTSTISATQVNWSNTATFNVSSGAMLNVPGTFAGATSVSSNFGLTLAGAGLMVLSGSNGYAGTTTINGGELSLANSAALSATSGITFGGGTLQYTASNTVDYSSKIVSSSGAISIDTNGQPVVFNNSLASSNSGGLTKLGGGILYLKTSNAYSGPTNVNVGTLALNQSSSDAAALPNTSGVTVAGGATLQVIGYAAIGSGASGNLALAGGATGGQGILSFSDAVNNTSTLKVFGNLTLGSGTLGSLLNYNLGSTSGASDTLTVGGSVTAAGTSTINLNVLSTVATGTTTYNLITATGGGLSASNFTLGARPAGFDDFSLGTPTANALVLSVTAYTTPGNAYWTGAASQTGGDGANNWGYGANLAVLQSNWSTNQSGTSDAKQVPGAITNVYFTAANAAVSSGTLTTQLDANYPINSLTFDTSSASATINTVVLSTNGKTLTIGAQGLTVGAADTSNTVISGGGAIQLGTAGAAQSWANNSNGASLAVSAAINGSAVDGTQTLTIDGNGTGGIVFSGAIGDGGGAGGKLALAFEQAGKTVLSGSNTYSGGTTLNAGTLQLGSNQALGSPGGALGINSATLDLDGNSPAVGALSGNPLAVITNSGTQATLTVAPATASVFNGLIENGNSKIGLVIDGPAALTLAGSNAYSGGTTLAAGQLNIGNAAALGTGTLAISSGSIDNTSGGPLALNNIPQTWNGSFTYVGSTNNLDLGAGAVTVIGTDTVTVSASALIVDGAIGGSGTLIKSGTGTLVLTASNNYSGGTTLAAGQLNIGNAAALSTGTFSISGGSIDNTSGGPLTLSNNIPQNWNGSFTYVGSTQGLNLSTGAVTLGGTDTLTVSANALTVGGPIGGSGTLIKSGSGTLVLNGVNTYTGATTVNGGGTLLLGVSSTYAGPTFIGQATLSLSAPNTFNGGITFGTAAGIATSGTLNLSAASGTAASLNVQTNSATPNIVTIGSGQSLTINGAAGLTVGGNNITTSTLTISGAGSLVVANTNASVTIGSGTNNYGSLDLTGLGSVTLGTSGAPLANVYVGYGGNGNGGNPGAAGTLLLSNSTNSVTTAALNVGVPGYGNNPGSAGALMVLGSGANTLAANNIYIGGYKGTGTVAFASSASGSPGSVTITDATGGGTDNIYIGDKLTQGSSGFTDNGLLDVSGHTANVNAASVTVALENGSGAGGSVGTLDFDTGVFTAGALNIALAQNTGSSGGATGTVNIGGGSVTVGAVNMAAKSSSGTGAAIGQLNVYGGNLTITGTTPFTITSQSGTASTNPTSGTLNITGGIVTSDVDITKGTAASNTVATVTLNGGLLNLAGNDLGGGTAANEATIDNLNLESGTLENVGEINNGQGLNLTSGGTLVLAGTNTYTNGTTVSNGTLIATNNEAIEDGSNLYVGNYSFPFETVVGAGDSETPASNPEGARPAGVQGAAAAVPEPATLALLAAGLVAAVAVRQRRKN